MSEKVLLTVEQAEAIEMAKTKEEIDWLLEDSKSDWMFEYRSLNGLTTSQLARAFYIGYEIEPEKPKFQPGDKVIHINYTNHIDWKQDFKIAEVLKQSHIAQTFPITPPDLRRPD